MNLYKILESDLVPEPWIRWGIRRMLSQKLRIESAPTAEAQQTKLMAFVEALKQSPIAIETDAANTQHYEVPSRFFELVLGPRRKYSSAYWQDPYSGKPVTTLAEAEEIMLALTCERAQIEDGQTILDLGCGWGSLSLWLAEQYPHARIIGLSNSTTQKVFIDGEAQRLGLKNLTIYTANIVTFDGFPNDLVFDRIVSIEMFEHMKNYKALLAKVSSWLKPDGKLFIHIFTHRCFAYHYEDTDGTDWLTKHFFSGGTMPSDDLLLYFQQDVQLERHWVVNGDHYEKTANAWLANMKTQRHKILPILAETYGPSETRRWWVYWKLFFLACAELWGYHHGNEWIVSHYRFRLA